MALTSAGRSSRSALTSLYRGDASAFAINCWPAGTEIVISDDLMPKLQ